MLDFLTILFLIVAFTIVFLRISLIFNRHSKKLALVNLIALVVGMVVIIACCICAAMEGKVEPGLAIACTLLLGGCSLLIIVPLILSPIQHKKYMEELYQHTNQRPNEEDYGFSKDNPIWAGTCEHYMRHLASVDGKLFSWKYSKKYNLPYGNKYEQYSGIGGCDLYKIKIIFNNKKVDTIYIVAKQGLEKMSTWHAPKGYKYLEF